MQERFTVSEVVLMGWRSQEQTYKMKQRMKRVTAKGDESEDTVVVKRTKKSHHYGPNDVIPEGLPERFYNEEGEVDLSKVKFKDALKYLNTIGLKFPMPTQGKRSGIHRDVEKAPSMSEIFGSD